MGGSELGIVVVDSSGQIASNPEATRILSFPHSPPPNHATVAQKVEQLVAPQLLIGEIACASGEIISGNRRYTWLAGHLCHHSAGTRANVVLILRRPWRMVPDLGLIASKYGLTPRERECVEYLLLGLSNKNIAQRMRITASTVNTFMHIIMVKLGATSRCNILLRICGLWESKSDTPSSHRLP